MFGKLCICLFFWLSIAATIARGDQLSVPSGSYETIQSAIESANPGDEVVVAPGLYMENLNFGGRAITVRSEDPDDPNVVAETILDGSEPTDPNFGSVVIFNSGEGNDSVLEGFTITGGTGSWILVSWEYKGEFWNRCGGGVLCYNMSQPTITKNVFRDNLAGQGGGVYIYGDPVNPADPSNPPVHISPIISDNEFISNSAIIAHGYEPPSDDPNNDHGDGGAIVGFQGCDAAITGNLIQNNHADWYGGGIHLRQWSHGVIAENDIIDNESALGAGIHITYNSSPGICENIIVSNQASGLGGGGVYVYYFSNPHVERNIITKNTSSNGAGIGVFWDSAPVIRNNLIYKNKGQGIRVKDAQPIIEHNTITRNTSSGIESFSNASPRIEHNLVTDNEAGYGISAFTGNGTVIRYNDVWSNVPANYNPDVSDPTGQLGNISARPGYRNASQEDYRLNYDSGCINAGDPNFTEQPDEFDYEGNPRVLGQYVDIGADEAWPVWNVTRDSQYETIQQAIDDATEGDEIVLTKIIFRGAGNRDIDFHGKAITVRSSHPDDPEVVKATVIDCEGSLPEPHRGFYFHNVEDPNSILSGLTITNGAYVYEGGAVKCTYGSSPIIRNCVIINNSAKDRGGGIYCGYESNPIITHCYFASNTLAPVGYGGGIYCYLSSPTVSHCEFYNNSAVGSGRHGGGICCFGNQNGHSNPVVTNCIFSGNSAGHRGGGLYAYWSSPTFINCTVVGNRSLEGGGVGSFGRDYIPGVEAHPVLINCIVRNNRAELGPEAAIINTYRVWGVYEHAEMTISYSNIQGGQTGVFVDTDCILHWGEGNIEDDPNFTDSGYWHDNATPADPNDDYYVVGNYHLTPGSACIDVGDSSAVAADVVVDIDAEDRIVNQTVDIGSDEFFVCSVDINTDGRVDLLDLYLIHSDWLEQGPDSPGDLSGDDDINLEDYALLAPWWLWRGAWLTE